MTTLQSAVVLTISLLVVTLGAELLVRGASLLALRTGVSPLFVGLTIVGFGTSSPELSASVAATLRGASGVSVGNVIGSNIFNVAVILGITAVVQPIRIELAAMRRDVAVAVAAAMAPWLALAFNNQLPRVAGAGFIAVLVAYLIIAYRASRRAHTEDAARVRDETIDTVTVPKWWRFRNQGWVTNVVLVVVGLALLVQGSRWFVDSAIEVARLIGASELLIGLTVVAVGTSLPELVTSLVAAYRRNTDIAVGNVIGSNIFNVFGVLGVCSLLEPQSLGAWVLAFDVPVMLASTLVLVPLIRSGGMISRREGWFLLVSYGVYLTVLALRGS